MSNDLQNLTREEKEKLLALLEEKESRAKYNYIDTLWLDDDKAPTLPGCLKSIARSNYPKHLEFFKAGAEFTERAFIAANRCGKTLTGDCELYWHASGKYPEWWEGKRFNKPIVAWMCGDRYPIIKDGIQALLCGALELGTGIIPKSDFASEPTCAPGGDGCYGTYHIKHVSGGVSKITVKTYQSGVDAFKSAAVDVVMLDEEVPLAIYTECQMRTVTTGGLVYLTFTPDKGLTDTVLHFLDKPAPGEARKYVAMIGWSDIPHLSPKVQSEMLATIPPNMRDCKTKGIPYQGAGAIYPIPEDEFLVTPFQIPPYWPRTYGFDPGWQRTAAVFGAYDPESECWYLYDEYYRSQAEAEVHAGGIQARGSWLTGVADPHGSKSGRGINADSFLEAYEKLGLQLVLANPCGPGSVELGIQEVYSQLSGGRIKVFRTLQNWLYEFRIYRRDDKGKIVATNNHLMDATRYLILTGKEVMTTFASVDTFNKPQKNLYTTGRSSITGY